MLKSSEKNHEINSISFGSTLSGDLVSSGDVRIDGTLNVSIKTEGKLVLGERGIIEGDISCSNAIVAGEIKATIVTQELLTLKSTAKLSGEIVATRLAVEPGAVFSGKCSMGPVIKNISKNSNNSDQAEKEKTA